MVDRPSLSKAELEVARLVWGIGEATVRQVLEALPRRRQLDYKTVQTYLRRLEAKGYLFTRREGKRIVYRARVRPAQVMRDTIEDFVVRLFDGEALPLVEHLIHDRGLKDGELEKLRAMLDEVEESERTRHTPKKGRDK
jgi:BlaI family transcriptional regulator, penicillinase repressor